MALEIKYDHSLLKHNTFGIDARTDCFIEYGSEEELQQALRMLHDHECPKILNVGAGSNLLFTADFEGAVLHSAIRSLEVTDESNMENVFVRVGSGYCWDAFVALAVSSGWYGAENLSAIPGDVGAAAVQNIGAYGAEVKDIITKVEAVDVTTGEKRIFPGGQCCYSYRNSIFKRPEYKKYAITYVTFHLSTVFEPNLKYKALQERFGGLKYQGWRPKYGASDIRRAVCEMRAAKLPDPAILGNAGSFFMNPVVPREKFSALAEKFPDIPHFEAKEGFVKLSAAWLIERSGWKGRSLGPAGVYEKQPLVLVNLGGATAEDIINLSDEIIASVIEHFGIELHPEVNFI